jgi:Outer membrane protein beta-barrel domain
MIKKVNILLSAIVLFTLASQAQTTDAEVLKVKKSIFTVNNTYKKPSKDYVMLQAGFNTWMLPSNSPIKMRQRGHELNMYLCYDFPFIQKNLSFAAGVGIGSSNIYLDSMVLPMTGSNIGTTDRYANFIADSLNYKRYKLSLNYFEVPFEFRYFANTANRNRGFKASIGVRIGALMNAHTKGVRNLGDGNMKDKQSSRRFFETWRLMPNVRLGWGNFSVYSAYQINEVFKANNTQGIGVRPFSVGFCISGL